ncbi:MAG TPA: type II toxin-antitoxin system prevent-host-death family antitoxin [Vicinamibacterales bacterium]|nr:type II toxin-antitoxin system prevent-host-death family antitoxin [Vicinamibacterales bacterium]
MIRVTIHAAKTQLSRLIRRVEQGESVIIARADQPVAKLVPVDAERPVRAFGAMKGHARVTAAFFDPLPAAELDEWGE